MNLSVSRLSCSSLVLWLLFGVVACYFLYPPRDRLKFGIDLVGGTYITLGVEANKAVHNELLSLSSTLNRQLKRGDLPMPISSKADKNSIVFAFEDAQAALTAQREFGDETDFFSRVDGSTVVVTLADEKIKAIEKWAVEGTVDVLRTRLNSLGVAEISIFRSGERNIIIELPDVQDPVRAKKMIGTPALLEFKLVDYIGDSPAIASSKEDLLDMLDGEVPEGSSIFASKSRSTERGEYYLLQDYSEVTGRHLKDATPTMSQSMGRPGWGVSFTLSREGGERFGELTRNNINRRLAILVDGKVLSAPNISSEITTNGEITGQFGDKEAKELSLMLKSGAFVAPVTFEEERRVGPSLGYDSIMSGLLACLVGLGLLLVFSVFYYKLSGLFAFFALIYNLILVLLALSWFGAALTLPGIAGMVLTIGMAIDASILIYERIKELLADGEPVRKAVKLGFANAAEVILDGNITTFIVGIVLYKFGTGPIRGFAITMMIGIISTLITGFFFLRSMFDCILAKKDVHNISI